MDSTNNKKGQGSKGNVILMLLSVASLAIFQKTAIPEFLIWLISRGDFPDSLRLLTRMQPIRLAQLLLYVLSLLVFVVTILRSLFRTKPQRPSSVTNTPDSFQATGNRKSSKTSDNRSNLMGQDTLFTAGAQTRTGPQTLRPPRNSRPSQSYRHSMTGKQRYLDQLDEFLENGLVTKEEYKEMRKKYEEMD